MAYNAIDQNDHEKDVDDQDIHSATPSSPFQRPSPSDRLFLDTQNENGDTSQNHAGLLPKLPTSANSLSQMVRSIASKSTNSSGSYDMVEEEDYDERMVSPVPSPEKKKVASRGGSSTTDEPLVLSIPRPRPLRNPATASSNNTTSPISPRALFSKDHEPIVRTSSGHSIALRHPTPDLQVLQGAYVGNIDKLEKTAEQLSMTSSIDDAIRELHMEQKRSDSRRSSILSQLNEMPQVSRQVSNASSIVELNSAARSGGYSPAAYMMSPKGSFSTTTRGRSASKSSRFGNRPEPELEGRPLDSFVNSSFPSLVGHQTNSIAEQDESSSTLTRPVVDHLDNQNMAQPTQEEAMESRPQTAASTSTYEQAEKMFADFDGIHTAPRRPSLDNDFNMEDPTISFSEIQMPPMDFDMQHDPRRMSSATHLGIAEMGMDNGQARAPADSHLPRPQSYADPSTGQQMVYYPAPVPMMLSLPQKLSKNPSSTARNKRRSEMLNNIPAAARQSAIWLPDVLETNDEPLAENDEAQKMEYIPQHQRMSMGGRRNTRDLEHMPPHLRANVFFELQGHQEVVELKEQSAVTTLDSILDASAHAPVGAFTDHAFAGQLGAEVYGKARPQSSKAAKQLLIPEKQDKPKKRASSINLLLGRRASSSNLLDSDDKRASTMANVLERKTTRSPIEDDDDDINNRDTALLRHSRGISGATDLIRADDSDLEDEGQRDDEVYHGPPTTLLAELQLRKQQQKTRTRPLTAAYPNGVHSTLLQMDTVLQLQQKARKQKQVNLAWQINQDEDPDAEDDEDVPLALLGAAKAHFQETERPLGLMERRDLEDNEPLSRRRARITGQPMPSNRASTMMHLSVGEPPEEVEGETLAQRIKRLKEQGGTGTGLPAARPVSGDFASEMMSQFGGELLKDDKGKGKEIETAPANEEEETLGQRRKRLQAEREAREKEVGAGGEASQEGLVVNKRRSMADILSAHPAAGAGRAASFTKLTNRPATGLLGLHEKQSQQRASTMTNFVTQQTINARHGRVKSGMFDEPQKQPGMNRPPQPANYNMRNMPGAGFPQYAQPMAMNYGNPMMMGYANAVPGYNAMGMPMQGMPMQGMPMQGMPMQLGPGGEPLNQGQLDMVERWRQSVMH
ncbi:5-methylthioadenosine s-adenosylhomocysteine protein [Rutstroemia sp. NJR-2017a WRK4]|nr:5-methylthioadenosine s-adenosylhomocysteine protein [Rutstroemia sp. NJR-2017a WRK4]